MIRGIIGRWWSQPRTRLRIARVMVIAAAALALIGLVTARWGLVFAGIIVVGLAAGIGPARIRRRSDRESS